jgi:cystathionine beta-lyase/cystathionine gamma-synthase
MKQSEQAIQTRVVHSGREVDDTTAVSTPIYQTSTYVVRTPEEGADLALQTAPDRFYTRYGSPNTNAVEAVMMSLEGTEAALALGSGMAAISAALLSNLRSGDHVVAQNTHYTATLSLLHDTLPAFGIGVTQVDQRDHEAFERAIRPNTAIVYTESPTNPTLDLTDLRATAALAREAGVLSITDNTFASSYNQRPVDLGYDIVIHSATKYLNGHADVTAGVICARQSIVDRAWEYGRIHGPVLHPFEAWLLRRGLKTYGMRMDTHNRNALQIAKVLEAHPSVARVYYPGLASHPQHLLAQQQMLGGFGGMLSFELKDGYEAGIAVLRQVKLCLVAVSLGGVETLITHPASMIHSRQSDEELQRAGISPGLIRLSVGVEDARDIIMDLDQALAQS